MRNSTMKELLECWTDDYYFKPTRGIHLSKSKDENTVVHVDEIYDRNTKMAELTKIYDKKYDCYQWLIVITMQRYRSQPTWQTHKKDLIKSAQELGFLIVFVPEFDIGFGSNDKVISSYKDKCKDLIKVAQYSNDEDIRTACVLYDECSVPVCFTCNQIVDECIYHAEHIMSLILGLWYDDDFSEENLENHEYTCYSMLEPCYDCLNELTHRKVTQIYWSEPHKQKWTTDEYIQLVNDINNKTINWGGKKIKYNRVPVMEITEFYHPELKENKKKRSK